MEQEPPEEQKLELDKSSEELLKEERERIYKGISHLLGNMLGRMKDDAYTVERLLPDDLPIREEICKATKRIRLANIEVTLAFELLRWSESNKMDDRSIIQYAKPWASFPIIDEQVDELIKPRRIYGYSDNLSVESFPKLTSEPTEKDILIACLFIIARSGAKEFVAVHRGKKQGMIKMFDENSIQFSSFPGQNIIDKYNASEYRFDPQGYGGTAPIARWLIRYFVEKGWKIVSSFDEENDIQTIKIEEPSA